MPPTALALLVSPVPAETVRQRTDGISVVSLGLGVPADFRRAAPWLLGGAKTLSYAVNMAALRHAHALGADDVVFTSLEGQVLEGPTSTVVWAAGGALHTPPAGDRHPARHHDGPAVRPRRGRRLADGASPAAPSTTCTPPTRSGCCRASAGAATVHTLDGVAAGRRRPHGRVRELLAR